MKILRKRVGSLKIEDNDIKKIKIINDSIFLNQKIIFNYLPIKNLTFFTLKIEKSNIESKYWVFLDLTLYHLYKDIISGKIITSRDLIFDMIRSSLNRLKILNTADNFVDIKECNSYTDIINDFNFKHDMVYCFEKKFVKYGKIYFDLNKKLITVDKCKKRRIKLPSIIIFKNYKQLIKIIHTLCPDIIDKDSLLILSSKDSSIINSSLFNPFTRKFDSSNETIVYSEDLNFQMDNYLKEIGNNEFLSQLEFESNNFFYSKKNIFILTNSLSEVSINYLSFCNFEKIFMFDVKDIKNNNKSIVPKNILSSLVYNYEKLRISRNDKDNNMLVSNYILTKRVYLINDEQENSKLVNIKIDNFPYVNWKEISDKHFLSLERNYNLISNFLKIGINNDWSTTYIENLKKSIEKPVDSNCPISLTKLDSFAIITECLHYFNLKNIIKWIEKNNECPICRSTLNINNFKFINIPDYSNFINQIKNKDIIIIADKLWYDKLKEFDNIILQDDIINDTCKLPKNDLIKILNLSSLTNEDIIYIYDNSCKNAKIQFINLISND